LRLVLSAAIAIATLESAAACGKEQGVTAPIPSSLVSDTLLSLSPIRSIRPHIAPRSLALALSFLGNNAQRLTFILSDGTPALSDRGGVVWESTDSTVAVIDAAGVVRVQGPGRAFIRGTVGDYVDSVLVQSSQTTDGIGLIAHRGFGAFSPENTLPAFRRALSIGADAVEMDVMLTRDTVPVIMHDLRVDRTTNGTGAVADLTLEQVRRLDACARFRVQWPSCQVPTLREALELVRARHGRALVDLKGVYTDSTLAIVLRQVMEAGMRERVMFTAFDLTYLQWIRQRDKVVQLGQLATRRLDPSYFAAIAPAAALYEHALLDGTSEALANVDALRSNGIDVGVWTLTSELDALAALRQRNVRLITDVPLIRQQLRPQP